MKERGSILLLVLFVCVGVAVLVQTLTVIVLCADRALVTADSGRRLTKEKDQALAVLRNDVLSLWAPLPWSSLPDCATDVEVKLEDVEESDGRVLAATARHGEGVSPVVVSAWLERGRDGLDLPVAGLVAESASSVAERTSPCIEGEEGVEATVWLRTTSSGLMLAPGVETASLDETWGLDEGWRAFFREAIDEEQGRNEEEEGTPGVAAAAGVTILFGDPGRTVELPDGWGVDPGCPSLAVVIGGATLGASGRGERWGVIVVDQGGVGLENTFLHGALFAGGIVDFGRTGVLSFSPAVLRSATDRSLVRSRLVPGTRRETIEPAWR